MLLTASNTDSPVISRLIHKLQSNILWMAAEYNFKRLTTLIN